LSVTTPSLQAVHDPPADETVKATAVAPLSADAGDPAANGSQTGKTRRASDALAHLGSRFAVVFNRRITAGFE
jgi:hypothetical protein